MEQKEMRWKNAEGELEFDTKSHIWYFCGNSKEMWITAWCGYRKKVTEILIKGEGKEIILEILEKNFNEEWYNPKKAETARDLLGYCKTLSRIDMEMGNYYMKPSIYQCVTRLAQQLPNIRELHIYYGNGLFFGLKKNILGQVKRISSIPCRSVEVPGTRLD